MNRFISLWMVVFFLFCGGISVYAAESPQVPANASQGIANTPSSPNSSLNIKPISPGESVVKMKKMEGDVQHLGEGLAPGLSKYAIVAGVVMILIGMVFAKKLVQAGLTMLGLSIVVYFLLGDMNKTSQILQKLVSTLQSYF